MYNLIVRGISSRFLFPFLLLLWVVYFLSVGFEWKLFLRGSSSAFDAEAIYQLPSKGRIEHLVVVAGHAVLRMNQLAVADRYDSGWYLLPYQQNQGFPAILSAHIKKGIELAHRDPDSLLILSGGQTRRDVGPTSEAASYYYLANEKKWFSRSVLGRVYLEEFSRDSFENLLFSICRFREVQGYYPSHITVVGFDFKSAHFSELHRASIGYPASNFTYIGVQSPAVTKQFNQDRAVAGEAVAVASFKTDQYGCNDPSLRKKRSSRNPFRRAVPYSLSCPELQGLLQWCGPQQYQIDALPWSRPPPAAAIMTQTRRH